MCVCVWFADMFGCMRECFCDIHFCVKVCMCLFMHVYECVKLCLWVCVTSISHFVRGEYHGSGLIISLHLKICES